MRTVKYVFKDKAEAAEVQHAPRRIPYIPPVKVTNPMSEHSRYSPSGFERWNNCPASVKFIIDNEWRLPEEQSSPYAAEGTKAHEAAEVWLRSNVIPESDDLRDNLWPYVEYIQGLKCEVGFYEEKLKLPNSPVFGTADYIGIKGDTLHVVDLKYGAGIAVSPIDNPQLKLYGLMALERFNDQKIARVVLTVVQPRKPEDGEVIRSWEYTPQELLVDFKQQVLDAVAHCEDAEMAYFSPGDHCRWCKAAPICDPLRERSLDMAKDVFDPETKEVSTNLTPEKISEILSKLSMAENFIDSFRKYAFRMMSFGTEVPGYKLVEKRSVRKWKEGSEQELTKTLALNGFEASDLYESKLKSPAQIEKELAKADRHLIESFITKQSSGLTIAEESDKRAAVTGLSAKDIFTEIDIQT